MKLNFKVPLFIKGYKIQKIKFMTLAFCLWRNYFHVLVKLEL